MITTKIVKITKTTVRAQLKLSNFDLTNILRAAGFKTPPSAVVHVDVPGGGDWSNCALPIDAKTPLHVSWVEETVVEEE